jgi:glycerol uptake facilitator-like aquaporin
MDKSHKFLIEDVRIKEKNEIRERIRELPEFLKAEGMLIFIFEALGTFFLAYGVCVSEYLLPFSSKLIPNIYWTFFISCYLFLGISAAAPFTGGHVNPAVTVGLVWNGMCESRKILTYIFSQLVGAFIGVFICTSLRYLDYNVFGHSAEVYAVVPTQSDILLDGFS